MNKEQQEKFVKLMQSHPDGYSLDFINEQVALINEGNFTAALHDSACWAYNFAMSDS